MINLNSKNHKVKLFMVIVLCGLFTFSHAQIRVMKEACDVHYNGDPSELKDSTINVPGPESVALSARVIVDALTDTTVTVGGTPSLFFIIDHSGSMYQNPGNDVDGLRFSTSLEFIDSIMARFPSAEVGIAVFRQHLYYDPADDSRFVACPGYSFGAYLPFLKLDSSYLPIGESGYQIVSKYLESVSNGNYVNLVYVPTNVAQNSASTNINVGFAAAKHAFQSAIYAKNRQFIIFLSDGDANVTNGPNTGNWDFVTDVTDIPTTFTIFFTSSGTAPANLVTMTTNIQGNAYSTNNPKSNIWAIDVADLMTLLMDNIMIIITGTVVGLPVDITVNGTTISDYDTVNGIFTFDDHFPLTGVKTDFDYTINYTIAKDSILPNGDTIVVIGDSAALGNFSVVVDPTVTVPPDWYLHTFEMICWQRDLQFYYNNAEINSVNEIMSPIELRFDWIPGDKDYAYTKADVEVITTQGLATDKETYTLSASGTNRFIGTFPRIVIEDTQTPTQGNGIVEHYKSDEFIATFRNNESVKLPLDTIRDTIPFELSGSINIASAYYFDNDANGYVDSIYVEATTDISGGLTDAHVQEIIDSALTLPAFRDFTVNGSGAISGGGFYIDVTEGNTPPTTYVTNEDILVITSDILSTGGWIDSTTVPINDRVAPIIHWDPKAAYLIDYQLDTISDTLGVKFSEPIENVTHEQPFYFLDVSPNPDTNYTVRLGIVGQPKPDSLVFYVIDHDPTYMEEGDSLWIHETNRVKDIVDNNQNNISNTRRMLYVERRMVPYDLNPYSISPIDINNINDPNFIIPQNIIDILINQNIINDLNLSQNNDGDYIGMIIVVSPDDLDFLLPDFRLKGDLTIYDAVGNQVVPMSKMGWDAVNKSLVWAWNAKNQNGRTVGAGMYLVLIEIQETTPSLYNDENGPKQVKRHFVGVKN